jgi:hypothetical protein
MRTTMVTKTSTDHAITSKSSLECFAFLARQERFQDTKWPKLSLQIARGSLVAQCSMPNNVVHTIIGGKLGPQTKTTEKEFHACTRGPKEMEK